MMPLLKWFQCPLLNVFRRAFKGLSGILIFGVLLLAGRAAADPIEDSILATGLGSNWKSQWNQSTIIRFSGTLTYSKDGSASFSVDNNDLVVKPASAIIAWVDSGQTLQCCRYAFWLQSDGKKASFISKIFGGKNQPPKSNPGSPLRIQDDVASPQINIVTADPTGWPGGRPDRLTVAFKDYKKPIVYLCRGNGKLLVGEVQFVYASPQIIAQGVNDTLEAREQTKAIDGGTAREVKARGEFKHVHRVPANPPSPPVKIHFVVIEPTTNQ